MFNSLILGGDVIDFVSLALCVVLVLTVGSMYQRLAKERHSFTPSIRYIGFVAVMLLSSTIIGIIYNSEISAEIVRLVVVLGTLWYLHIAARWQPSPSDITFVCQSPFICKFQQKLEDLDQNQEPLTGTTGTGGR